jgi:arginine decarboxylase
MSANIHPVTQTYAINRWGEGYFGINPEGNLTVRPDRQGPVEVDLHRLAYEVREANLAWPVLVRFTDILRDRVRELRKAFAQASAEYDYEGSYTAVYPIKVNQQRSVVDEILVGGEEQGGLEAGSKPELMAVLAMAQGEVIICNGYKDREYIRLALMGNHLGHRVYIVIEKPSELELVLEESANLGIEPRLGVRVRVASSAIGKWQDSGGERAKFGLSAGQVLAMVERLKGAGKLAHLQLLHSHLGSQIPNIRDIRRGMSEVGRYYAGLRDIGVPISIVDVGGGLGVDYEGTGTRHFCSINYSLDGYARTVVRTLKNVCEEQGIPEPDIITEAGRAMTAHHAVLITNVIERESAPGGTPPDPDPEDPPVLESLFRELERADNGSPLEIYQEAVHGLNDARAAFERGELTLAQRAKAEQLYFAVCRRLHPRLQSSARSHRELLDELNVKLADKVFCNFSLFQSMPDVWAIDQIFPVIPLQRLNETPTCRALIQDLTCDSDGRIEYYVDQEGVESTLPMHSVEPGQDYLLGIFMLGAYQEVLGDMHNLFGDTDAVNLELDGKGGYRLTQQESGDSVEELLAYVHFDPEAMLASYRRKLEASGLSAVQADQFYVELKAGLQGYTYLED